MSRTAPTEIERAELMFRCSFCGAPAGEWCERMSSHRIFVFAKDLHQTRYDLVRRVVALSGYEQMLEDQWARNTAQRTALQVWRQNIYGDTTGRYGNEYLKSRIDALLEQS